jgi:hypothetical protein
MKFRPSRSAARMAAMVTIDVRASVLKESQA